MLLFPFKVISDPVPRDHPNVPPSEQHVIPGLGEPHTTCQGLSVIIPV